jgi:hypothetical protein
MKTKALPDKRKNLWRDFLKNKKCNQSGSLTYNQVIVLIIDIIAMKNLSKIKNTKTSLVYEYIPLSKTKKARTKASFFVFFENF